MPATCAYSHRNSIGTNEDRVDHKLYILRESTTRPELDIVSELPNENRPEEIGKPNEALYGVRFLSDRAYAVTFEQIDPLYVIDLLDPTRPIHRRRAHGHRILRFPASGQR